MERSDARERRETSDEKCCEARKDTQLHICSSSTESGRPLALRSEAQDAGKPILKLELRASFVVGACWSRGWLLVQALRVVDRSLPSKFYSCP
jgi:hypothetical protein